MRGSRLLAMCVHLEGAFVIQFQTGCLVNSKTNRPVAPTERNRAHTSAQICNKQGLTGRLPGGSWITHASRTVLRKNLMYLHINAKNPELPRFMTKQARIGIPYGDKEQQYDNQPYSCVR